MSPQEPLSCSSAANPPGTCDRHCSAPLLLSRSSTPPILQALRATPVPCHPVVSHQMNRHTPKARSCVAIWRPDRRHESSGRRPRPNRLFCISMSLPAMPDAPPACVGGCSAGTSSCGRDCREKHQRALPAVLRHHERPACSPWPSLPRQAYWAEAL